jgi:hypothetical protein
MGFNLNAMRRFQMIQRYKDALFGGALVLIGYTSGQGCGSEKQSSSNEAVAQNTEEQNQSDTDILIELRKANELLASIKLFTSMTLGEARKIGYAFNKDSRAASITIDDFDHGNPYESLRVSPNYDAVFKTSETETVKVNVENSTYNPVKISMSNDFTNPLFIKPGYNADFKVSEFSSLGVKVKN